MASGWMGRCHGLFSNRIRLDIRLPGNRRAGIIQIEPSHPREDAQVDEVHRAKYEENDSDLRAEILHRLSDVLRSDADLNSQGHVPNVDEIEPDDKQLIHRIGQRLVAEE